MGLFNVIGNMVFHLVDDKDSVIDLDLFMNAYPSAYQIARLPKNRTWTDEKYDQILKEEDNGAGIVYGICESILKDMRSYGIRYKKHEDENVGYIFNHSRSYINTLHEKEKDALFVLLNKNAYLRYDNYLSKYPSLASKLRKYGSSNVKLLEAIKYIAIKNKDRLKSIDMHLDQVKNNGFKLDKEHADELLHNINNLLKINESFDEYEMKDTRYWAKKLIDNINYLTK